MGLRLGQAWWRLKVLQHVVVGRNLLEVMRRVVPLTLLSPTARRQPAAKKVGIEAVVAA
jgi:hypothetical protein